MRGTLYVAAVLTVGLVIGGPTITITTARAGSVRIVRGVPAASRARVVRSLRALAGRLEVCWRGARPRALRVEVSVGAAGRVTRSKQKTRGATAQCAAGVLAVQTLASTGRAYRMVVELGTSGASADIQSRLAPHLATLRSCYRTVLGAKATARGSLVLRFTIHPNGTISQPSVKSSTLGKPRVDRCLERAAVRIRLGAGVVARPVAYGLTLRFSGGGQSAASAGGGLGPRMQPKKRGPLPATAITSVMRQRAPHFTRCYDRVARRKRTLAGNVMLRFTVRANGTVRNVKIRETTLRNAKVESCMVRVGKTLRFPGEAGRAATKVWYPFSFRAR